MVAIEIVFLLHAWGGAAAAACCCWWVPSVSFIICHLDIETVGQRSTTGTKPCNRGGITNATGAASPAIFSCPNPEPSCSAPPRCAAPIFMQRRDGHRPDQMRPELCACWSRDHVLKLHNLPRELVTDRPCCKSDWVQGITCPSSSPAPVCLPPCSAPAAQPAAAAAGHRAVACARVNVMSHDMSCHD